MSHHPQQQVSATQQQHHASTSSHSQPPRLLIQNMVLTNFKSYAGTKTLGPFHKNFTSVVGPNGSGKSNVIDSLLFVLGRKATEIRMKKVSELIHKSPDFPNLQECRVDIHFIEIYDDDTIVPHGYRTVPNSNFIVTRIVNSSNQSKYKINDRSSTAEAIQDLLKSKGMDLNNNRWLILQGEVESISQMKPKATVNDRGILEYLEDIIGTNVYVEKIEKLSQDVEKLNEERNESLQLLKIAEKQKDALEGPKLEAEEYRRKLHELNIQRLLLVQIQKLEVELKNSEFQKQRDELAAERKELEESIAEHTEKMKNIEKLNNEFQAKHDSLTATLTKTKKDSASYDRKSEELSSLLKHQSAQLKKLKEKKEATEKKITEFKKKLEEAKISAPKLEKDIAKYESEKEEIQAKVTKEESEFMRKSSKFKGELESYQSQLVEPQKVCNSAQRDVDVTQNEIVMYQEKQNGGTKKYDELKALLMKSASEYQRLTAETEKITSLLDGNKKKHSETQEEYDEICRQETEAMKRRTTLMSELADAEQQKIATQFSGNSVLDKLLHAKQQKQHSASLSGLYNKLGNLGTIDAKYDIALSTAAAGSLSLILVETQESGKNAIEWLKVNNIGRGSFLALKVQQDAFPREKYAKKATPENLPRLFDLIQPSEEKFLPAFYFACRDTLVASSLEQATRVGYGKVDGQRWRVITLDGQLIEPAGTMSGGGKQVQTGGMLLTGSKAAASSSSSSSSSRGEGQPAVIDIKKAQNELTQLQQKLKEFSEAKKLIEQELKPLVKTISDLESALKKNTSACNELRTTIEEYKKRCKSLEASVTLTADELTTLKSLESQLKKQQSILAEAKLATKSITDQIDQIQSQIKAVAGTGLETVRKQLQKVNVLLGEAHEELNKSTVLRDTGVNKLKKFESELNEIVKEHTELQEDYTSNEEKHSALQQKSESLQKLMNDSQSALDENQSEFGKIKKDYELSKETLHKHQSDLVDFEVREHDFHKLTKETTIRLQYFEKKMYTLLKQVNKEILEIRKEHAAIEAGASVVVIAEATEMEVEEEKKEDEEEEEDEEMEESTISKKKKSAAAAKQQRGGRKQRGAASTTPASTSSDIDLTDPELNFEGCHKLLSADSISTLNRNKIDREIASLEEQVKKLSQTVNMSAIANYLEKEKSYIRQVALLDQITIRRDTTRKEYEELRSKRLNEFMSGFSQISMKLKEMYQMLTLGGDAELELVDSLDPFSEGIIFSVRPPKKSWKNITNLSGGEKTLSSLALVFALHHFKPTPLYVMDEIDAALDFKNVSIVANYIKERTKNAQFIIISLRNNMFELADRLVGIYKTKNQTQSIAIDPKQFVEPHQVVKKGEVVKSSDSVKDGEEDEKKQMH